MEGRIKLHRQIQENGLWTCEPFTKGQAWVDLLLLASHTESFFYIRGVKVNLERGQLAWGEVKLSERWRWSRSKLRKFLKDLEKEQQIEQHKGGAIQIITVLNYDKYQESVQQNVQQKDNRSTTEVQQKDIYNNVDNVKTVKKVNKFKAPTIDEVRKYCKERNRGVNPTKWFNHYTSNGWKVGKNSMKNWKAAIHTWEESDIQPIGKLPESKGSNLGGSFKPKPLSKSAMTREQWKQSEEYKSKFK